MIPRHSLPFDIGNLFSIFVKPVSAANPSDVEKAYADELGVREVILLPSVRAGIHIAILTASRPVITATGPAYTCATVHEAMARSGVHMRLLDSAADSFLMPLEDISATVDPGCALVLSEVYGIPYDLKILPAVNQDGPAVRILDMAMNIPSTERMRQLRGSDVALFSFGWGKPMYAGWGGIACLQDPEVAGRAREILGRWTTPESVVIRLQRSGATALRTVMNQRTLFGLSHDPHIYRMPRKAASPPTERFCKSEMPGSSLPRQWTSPMTTLNRKLALYNLRHSGQNAELRKSQAEIYLRSLAGSGILHGIGAETLPQSHFPVRIPSSMRNRMCDYLRGRGIDTSTLFPFPAGLKPDLYPNAARATAEVITLPLGPKLTPDEVRMVSQCVRDGLRVLGC